MYKKSVTHVADAYNDFTRTSPRTWSSRQAVAAAAATGRFDSSAWPHLDGLPLV